MRELCEDEVQELIDLSPSQEKAWKLFERAVTACKKENVYLYQVLEHVGGLNGNNIKTITNMECTNGLESGGPRDLNILSFPATEVCDAWADDTHAVILNGEHDWADFSRGRV